MDFYFNPNFFLNSDDDSRKSEHVFDFKMVQDEVSIVVIKPLLKH